MSKRFSRLSLRDIFMLLAVLVIAFLFNQFGMPYLQKNYPDVADKIGSVIYGNKTYRPEKHNNDKHPSSNQEEVQTKGHKAKFCIDNAYEQHLPQVKESLRDYSEMQLCYEGFAAYYKHSFKTALWTSEKLTYDRLRKAKGGEREKTFYQDPNVMAKFGDKETVKTTDYSGSGFDRGHLAPSADMEQQGMRKESFYLSNIVPQTPENNQNIWRQIELATRCLVDKKNDVYSVTVPVYNESPNFLKTRRGLNIAIPDYMAKAVFAPTKNTIGVFLTKNNKSVDEVKFISVDDLVKLSGVDPFPTLKGELRKKIQLPNPKKYDRTCN